MVNFHDCICYSLECKHTLTTYLPFCVLLYTAFITRPHSLNISEGENANFSCTGTHTSSFGMSWNVNGIEFYYDSHKHRSINEHQEEVLSESGGATRSVLTVPGIPINNNINVQCVLLSFMITQKSLYSGPAFLRIQGNDQKKQ